MLQHLHPYKAHQYEELRAAGVPHDYALAHVSKLQHWERGFVREEAPRFSFKHAMRPAPVVEMIYACGTVARLSCSMDGRKPIDFATAWRVATYNVKWAHKLTAAFLEHPSVGRVPLTGETLKPSKPRHRQARTILADLLRAMDDGTDTTAILEEARQVVAKAA